ncbi:MAG: hypothetical protein MRY76_15385 [Pseudomonadales bacterium]|nr:hypothetical protein [Pseudomonadales bacterium]
MRILYGIQGTGNGHLARARALVPALRERGLDLDFVLSGRDRQDYFNMELFGDYRCYRGLSLITERGRLRHWQTMRRNNGLQFLRDMKDIQVDAYDLVISDFEPVTAWAARRAGVKCIGISHQNAFRFAVPKVRAYIGSRLILSYFAPADINLGLHWHHFHQPVLPPLIESLQGRRVDGSKILVYMGFEDVDDIIEFVKPFHAFNFLIYAKVPTERQLGHIRVKPLSHSEFHADLVDCAGVVSNAGFELASECLALGKKLLVKPLAGQFEQLSNALALQALNRGTVIESLNPAVLEKWLQRPGFSAIPYPDVPGAIADWLAAGAVQSPADLAAPLWDSMEIPVEYDRRLGRALIPGLIS